MWDGAQVAIQQINTNVVDRLADIGIGIARLIDPRRRPNGGFARPVTVDQPDSGLTVAVNHRRVETLAANNQRGQLQEFILRQ
ncbi:hypothetical protein D3C78_1684520 [compost metagenome]